MSPQACSTTRLNRRLETISWAARGRLPQSSLVPPPRGITCRPASLAVFRIFAISSALPGSITICGRTSSSASSGVAARMCSAPTTVPRSVQTVSMSTTDVPEGDCGVIDDDFFRPFEACSWFQPFTHGPRRGLYSCSAPPAAALTGTSARLVFTVVIRSVSSLVIPRRLQPPRKLGSVPSPRAREAPLHNFAMPQKNCATPATSNGCGW